MIITNELLNLFVIRNSSENMYKEVSSICDSPDKDELLNMTVKDLLNLYPSRINDCDSKLKLDLVKTSLEKEVEKSTDYTAFLESKIVKTINSKSFDPIQHLEDLRLVKPKSLANQKVLSKEAI